MDMKGIPHWKVIKGKTVQIPAGGIEGILDEVKLLIEALEEDNEELKKFNDSLKSAHYKDEEIKRLAAEVDRLKRRYSIPEEYVSRGEKWFKNHQKKHIIENRNMNRKNSTCTPGHSYYSWIITPTYIDDIYEIQCECGATFNIMETSIEEGEQEENGK